MKSVLPRLGSYRMSSHRVHGRYGYSVWLRHLVRLAGHGIRGPFPTVVELGPGNSVATAVAAVLSGTDRYIGLDVLRHLAISSGHSVLDEIIELFHRRTPVPDADYPALRPVLDSYAFPHTTLGTVDLEAAADLGRIDRLRRDVATLATGGEGGDLVRYVVPWNADSVPAASADLVFTQAVLQELPHTAGRSALRDTLAAITRWLRPGGTSSHQVDLGLYGMEPWNLHWSWSGLRWALVRGRRDNFVNREPLSTYLSVARDCGLSVVAVECEEVVGVADAALRPRFRSLPERERRTRTAFIVLRKPA
ncbi:MAG TPA: hypothetical protein VMR23_05945 [Candidatus Limnocylindria bacterium]|nr:hypothetical protein [Candidatus Limnocylindria bacterium]